VKPLDAQTLLAAARHPRLVVTLKENMLAGGFGSSVLELFAEEGVETPVQTIGIPDAFLQHGSRDELLAQLDIDAEKIAQTVMGMLSPNFSRRRAARGH